MQACYTELLGSHSLLARSWICSVSAFCRIHYCCCAYYIIGLHEFCYMGTYTKEFDEL